MWIWCNFCQSRAVLLVSKPISQPPMDIKWLALAARHPSPILGGLLT